MQTNRNALPQERKEERRKERKKERKKERMDFNHVTITKTWKLLRFKRNYMLTSDGEMVWNRAHVILRMIMYNASLPMLGCSDLSSSFERFGCIKSHQQRAFITGYSN